MSQRLINIGTGYDTLDGDKLRDGGNDINLNFTELYKRAVSWVVGDYDAVTIVIVDNKAYILSDTTPLPFSSINFFNELAEGNWVLVSGGNYDDSWIQPSIDERVQFKGQWVQASYNANDWVVSGSWMGVAKVDTTEPFPPEASGTPFWLLPSTPTWEDLTLVGDIYQGLEFYGVQFNIVDGFRIWSNGVASETFRLFAYEVSGTGATTFLDFIDIGSNLPAGWNVVSLDQFGVLIPNQKYRLILETHADTNTTTLSDNWDWTPAEESPTAGNIGQTATGLHINEISGNATDQGAFLDDLAIGDDILISESGDGTRYNSYRIIGLLAKVGNVYNYEVTITASGDLLRDGRELDVNFTHKGVAVSTNYNRIVDYWPIPDTLPDQIQGFVTQDPDVATSPTPGLNNNAYGLDLFYETYVLSQEWFYIGIGEGSTNQGGSGDIEIVDNLTTQDATVALSGNMGYTLDQLVKARVLANENTQFTAELRSSGNGLLPWEANLVPNYEYLLNNYSPISEQGIAGEDLIVGDIVSEAAGATKTWYKANATILSSLTLRMGVVIVGGLSAAEITIKQTNMITGTGFTPGETLYVSETSGAITPVPPSEVGAWVRIVGTSIDATTRFIDTRAINYMKGDGSNINGVEMTALAIINKDISIEQPNQEGINADLYANKIPKNQTYIGFGFSRALANSDCSYFLNLSSDAVATLDGAVLDEGFRCIVYNSTANSLIYSLAANNVFVETPRELDHGEGYELVFVGEVLGAYHWYAFVWSPTMANEANTQKSMILGEPTGSSKAANQVIISDADYGDGSGAITGTLYFIKP